MLRFVLISTLFLLNIGFVLGQGTNLPSFSKQPFGIGEQIEFHSRILSQERTINVYLPQGYAADSVAKYPVIYLLDGSRDEDFIHIAGLTQFLSFDWIGEMPAAIVVGIGNVNRYHDFTAPSEREDYQKEFPLHGGSEKFINYIAEELQPLIEANYRANGEKSLIGQSLGGLLATEILFHHTELFGKYFIISPSLWWDEQKLLQETPNDLDQVESIYIAVGKEGPVMQKTAKKLYRKLRRLPNDYHLEFQYFPEQNHGDVLHLAMYDAIVKIFPRIVEDE